MSISFQVTWESALSITGWLIGLIGVCVSIFYGRKSLRLERERITLKWEDVEIAAEDLSKRISDSGFKPSLILTFGSKCGYLAHLISRSFSPSAPVVVGVTLPKGGRVAEPLASMLSFIETKRWCVGIPTQLLDYGDQHVLIVDDWVLSGDAIEKMCDLLVQSGVPRKNIVSATLVATDTAVQNGKAPSYYWKTTSSTNFFFPWGRAR